MLENTLSIQPHCQMHRHDQRPVTRSFDAFFDLRLNKRLNKKTRLLIWDAIAPIMTSPWCVTAIAKYDINHILIPQKIWRQQSCWWPLTFLIKNLTRVSQTIEVQWQFNLGVIMIIDRVPPWPQYTSLCEYYRLSIYRCIMLHDIAHSTTASNVHLRY